MILLYKDMATFSGPDPKATFETLRDETYGTYNGSGKEEGEVVIRIIQLNHGR